jgi:hypothetical protein
VTFVGSLRARDLKGQDERGLLLELRWVLMVSRVPDENDFGQFSMCISILRVV